jgi:hypothetical protein
MSCELVFAGSSFHKNASKKTKVIPMHSPSQHITLLDPPRRPTSAIPFGGRSSSNKFVTEPMNSQRRAVVRARNVSGGDVPAGKGAWK